MGKSRVDTLTGPSGPSGYTGASGVVDWQGDRYKYSGPNLGEAHENWLNKNFGVGDKATSALMNPRSTDDYAKAFAGQLQNIAGEQFAKQGRGINESMAARGMMGSRAYVDMMGELSKNKMRSDIDIAQRASLAAEDLASRDLQQNLSLAQYSNALRQQEAMNSMSREQLAMAGAGQGTAGQFGAFDRQLQLAQAQDAAKRGRDAGKSSWVAPTLSAVGGIAGSIFGGPIGTALGSAAGKGLASLFAGGGGGGGVPGEAGFFTE